MRYILALLLLFTFITPPLASETLELPKPTIKKFESYEEARQAAANDPNKRLFCMFSATWCDPCQQMKADVIFDKAIWESIHKYAIVYIVDVDVETRLAKIYYESGVWEGNLPTCFLYSKDTKKVIGVLEGYTSKQKFVEWWNAAAKRDQQPSTPRGALPSRPSESVKPLAQWILDKCNQQEIKSLIYYLNQGTVKNMTKVEPTANANTAKRVDKVSGVRDGVRSEGTISD
jgi:thioredoxin-related protein